MRMHSVMEHAFSMVPQAQIPRSSFDRSHGHKTTFDAGKLVPIFIDEALPGDTFNLELTAFARMATPIFPIMDNLFMETFFFAVPYRLVWENWERFNGAQDDPGDSIDFTIPVATVPGGGYVEGSLADYMGVPTGVDPIEVSGLPVRAYYRIFNEWFRDQNLTNSITIGLQVDDATTSGFNGTPANRMKRHDYFTSCLPWPQKGDSVTLPLGTTAIVLPTTTDHTTGAWTAGTKYRDTVAGAVVNAKILETNAGGFITAGGAAGGGGSVAYPANLYADLSTATAATINQLRQAFQVQKLLERDARGGTRYTEIVRSHFGVVSPDARLQRPEYLGGGSSRVNISPVAQTSETASTPQGNLSAFGTAHLHNHGFTKSFTEHCIVIGLVNVRADLTYQQGLNRMWSRQTRYDFYWPALAHIGEQAVLSKEIYADGSGSDEDVFGYQERYAEYRYKPSLVTGAFRSNAAATLDAWHLSQEFSSRPVLDTTFMTDSPPLDRVIAVAAEPHFLFDGYFNFRCARPMPLYGVPGLIDHF